VSLDPLSAAAITGIVLAGGLGRRMGAEGDGDDKGLRPFRGRPMAAHVIERLRPQVGAIVINANRNPSRWEAFGLPVVPDRIPGFAGPLAGLHAGMAFASTPWVITAPCDAPFLPDDLVGRMTNALLHSGSQIAVARTAARTHPVFALVARTLQPDLEAFLASGRRRIDAWYGRLHSIEVAFEDEGAFSNLNTPEELAHWEQARPGTPIPPRG
jgi:molybdopterin-guanine dinucleotide biosynthesis protein A